MMIGKRTVASILSLVIAGATLAFPTKVLAAESWGLVIGVDDYQHVEKLGGAVNDARDIAQALKKLGARDVKLLLNDAASRDGVLAAWKDIAAKARPGDTVYLTYAGHGAQARDGAGVLHQFVVLPDFDVKGDGADQIILDREFGQMLRGVPDLNIVFLVDSCHSGTMTRAYGSKRNFKVRAIGTVGVEDAKLASMARALPTDKGDVVLPHVVHLGAVQPDELDPEIIINDKPRGALSYAFSRAVEGAADTNRSGALEPKELEQFIGGMIGVATDGQQHPRIAVREGWSLPLARSADGGSAGVGGNRPQTLESPAVVSGFRPQVLSLAALNAGEAGGPEAAIRALKGVRGAGEGEAELVWDVGRGQISSHLGDVVSYPKEGATRAFHRAVAGGDTEPVRVQKVVDKMALVASIKEAAVTHNLTMGLSPNDRLHHAGDAVAFTVSGHRMPYLTLFNLASDGTVNFLYPQTGGGNRDSLTIPVDKPYRLDLTVQPPFGADHLVAITSREAMPELHAALAALDNTAAADRVGTVLEKQLVGKDYQIGIHPSFTAPK
ncbi:MAG: caspase family protein [Alphaproteobacteria bacterium]